MGPQRALKAKIGELLIERNLISRKQLGIALEEQDAVIDAVVQVIRVEKIGEAQYSIAGFSILFPMTIG